MSRNRVFKVVGEDFVVLVCVFLRQYQRVTDGRTDNSVSTIIQGSALVLLEVCSVHVVQRQKMLCHQSSDLFVVRQGRCSVFTHARGEDRAGVLFIEKYV